ncbi:hypothetical protein LP7551_03863 [Roseibium album]|nr:hypothetical protein LP7551_03863 [Roseibium album]
MMRKIVEFFAGAIVLALALFASAASYYWLGWPSWARIGCAVITVPLITVLWFWSGAYSVLLRIGVVALFAVFFVAYGQKIPEPQTFVPLHAKVAEVYLNGSDVEVRNFRDAVHPIGAPAEPVWRTAHFNLDDLVGAKFILQPFGNSLATVHVMTSFAFKDGRHLAVSVEARRTSWTSFDALAGFFKHDQLYIVLGTERDVLWKRLAHIPPNDLYLFDLKGSHPDTRRYLVRLLSLAGSLAKQPQFYSTISESCFTTLVNLSPKIADTVPWYDLRRWVPGASVGLFQELDLVDSHVSEQNLIEQSKLGSDVQPPWEFSDSKAWSTHLRTRIGTK